MSRKMVDKRIEITPSGLYFIGYEMTEAKQLLAWLRLALTAGRVFVWEKVETE